MNVLRTGLAILVLFLLCACSGPEQRKVKFFAKGKALFDAEKYAKAALEFKNAVQIDPKYSDALYMLGLTELRQGNIGKAFAAFSRGAELAPADARIQVQLGRLLLVKGDHRAALKAADQALAVNRSDLEAQILRGAVLLAMKETTLAQQTLQPLLDLPNAPAEVFLLMATLNNKEQDHAKAETLLLQGVNKYPSSLALNRAIADLYAGSGRDAAAAERVEKVIALEPNNLGNYLTLADYYWKTGQQEKGRAVLTKMISAWKDKEESHGEAAGFFGARNATADGEKLLLEGIKQVPGSFRLRHQLAELYERTGRGDKAVALLEECLKLTKNSSAPDTLITRNILARMQVSRGELAAAEQSVAEVLKQSPKDVEAHFQKGRIALSRKDGVKAVAEFRTVVAEKPGITTGYLMLAQAHAMNKELNLALDTLQQAQKIEPDSHDVIKALAAVHVVSGNPAKAEELIRGMKGASPQELHLALGDLFMAGNNVQRAEREYQELSRLTPGSPLGPTKLAALYLVRKDPVRAEEQLQKARRLAPDSGALVLALGRMLAEQGDYGRAIKEYEGLLARYPESWLVLNDLASLIADNRASTPSDLNRGLELARKSEKLHPGDVNVQDTLGWLLYRTGKVHEAVELLERVIQKAPEVPLYNFHLGMALVQDGNRREAKRVLKKALDGGVFPGREQAIQIFGGL